MTTEAARDLTLTILRDRAFHTAEDLAAATGFKPQFIPILLGQLRSPACGRHLIAVKKVGPRKYAYQLADA